MINVDCLDPPVVLSNALSGCLSMRHLMMHLKETYEIEYQFNKEAAFNLNLLLGSTYGIGATGAL